MNGGAMVPTHDIGARTEAGSLAPLASLYELARKAAKEAWEAAHHFHSGERWFGAAAAPDAELHIADRIGAGDAGAEAAPFVVDAGNDDWGTWTQIFGSDDSPIDSASETHYDFHRLRIAAAADTAQRYMLQIACQEDAPADDPGDGDCYTEFELTSAGVGALATVAPIEFQMERAPVGTKIWMRTRAPNQNTSTLSFYAGLHPYTDPDV